MTDIAVGRKMMLREKEFVTPSDHSLGQSQYYMRYNFDDEDKTC